MVKIKQNIKVSQDRKKNNVDKGITHKEFRVGKHVFLKVKDKMSWKLPKNGNKVLWTI